MPAKKIKLFIADDHGIVRQGLRLILQAEPDMVVVGEATNGLEAVKRARKLRPDVIIMDISMPGQTGIESMRQILRSVNSRVLILSVHFEPEVISSALAAGAAGYLVKESLDRELIAAVRTVMHGGTVLSADVSKRLFQSIEAVGEPRSLDGLTAREREVFFLLADGKSPTQVATSLLVSPKTVHVHRQHILKKLSLQRTSELIRFAHRHGLMKG